MILILHIKYKFKIIGIIIGIPKFVLEGRNMFDYSFISLLYFAILENTLNELVYKPCRQLLLKNHFKEESSIKYLDNHSDLFY